MLDRLIVVRNLQFLRGSGLQEKDTLVDQLSCPRFDQSQRNLLLSSLFSQVELPKIYLIIVLNKSNSTLCLLFSKLRKQFT